MARYAIPVQFVYDTHFIIEAKDEKEAIGTLSSNSPSWIPRLMRGSEVRLANEDSKWTSISVSTPLPLKQKAEVTTVKPSRRRAT